MKKLIVTALILSMTAALCGCGGTASTTDQSAEASTEASQTTETQTEDAAENTAEEGPMTLNPLSASVDLTNLTDCTIAVSFTTDSFNWMGGNFTAEVYDTLCYDAYDVSRLKAGDTIDTGDDMVEVKTVTDGESGIVVNEGEDNELTLWPSDGGTYNLVTYDDVTLQKSLGETELILSQEVVLNDAAADPQNTRTVSSDEIKAYMESLEEPYNTFDSTSTTVVIENGEVTEINRVWMP